jgi:hypothetical protein
MTPENKEKTNLEKPEKPAESSEGGSGFLSLSDLEPSKLHTASAGSASLSAVRHEPSSFSVWVHKHLPWLFNWQSLFYFALATFIIAMAWCGYSLINNHFTQLYGWDYSSQYVTFYYDFYDCWHEFFRTGKFVLYDTQTFLGTDNIGSNSYYGLFDPFVVAMIIFPRSAIPQMTAVMTFMKIVVATLCMRAYLKYMGIKEGTARFGALAFGFSGYMNFMVGFPTTVAACTWVPLILLGIEKVIKERKPSCLVWGLFLEGITSFFFLVVLCIWGVIYALWRYFWTLHKRTAKENWLTIAVGIGSFGVGLMLCSWTLLPSLRESALSGRTASIGQLYWQAILTSLKEHNFGDFFKLIFEQVGDNPGRELMGLVSFFYPTGGYLYLPLTTPAGSYTYDAWTASLFCYTPFVILFFVAMMNSVRQKRWDHLIAILLCLYLVFTTFAYYFFYAFTGNGYGRWFIILVPEIILYGCWAFDDRQKQPKYFMLTGTLVALFGTIMTYALTVWLLKDKSFSNLSGLTYWVSAYLTADQTNAYVTESRYWYVFYQCALVVVEGGVMCYFLNKEWLHHVMFGFVAVEAIVAGNMSFVYGSSWNLNWFNGGPQSFANVTEIMERINNQDQSYFRTYNDASGEKNYAMGAGYNGTSNFHSLMNFGTEDFILMTHISSPGGSGTAYGGSYYNPTWSGFYYGKRYALDTTLGIKYYVIKNDGYNVTANGTTYHFESQNVPFDCEYDASLSGNGYRVYHYNDADYATNSYVNLGHGVDDDKLYAIQHMDSSNYRNAFFSYTSATETMVPEQLMLDGAILEDTDAAAMPKGFSINGSTPYFPKDIKGQPIYSLSSSASQSHYGTRVYTTAGEDKYLPSSTNQYVAYGPAYFLKDPTYSSSYTEASSASSVTYQRDLGHVVFYPTGTYVNLDGTTTTKTFGDYFNDDPEGVYFDMFYYNSSDTRFYMIGDTFKKDSNGAWVVDQTDQVLNFEYHAIEHTLSNGNDDNYTNLFGMYAKGKVKYIVACANGPAWSNPAQTIANTQNFSLSSYFRLFMQEKQTINAQYAKLAKSKFQNVVQKSSNEYTFTTNFDAAEHPHGCFCVTSIAYDKGWSVTANGVSLPTYCLDGGLVGFLAPNGEASYDLTYVTPYIKGSSFLFAAGFLAYMSYLGYGFVKDVRRIKKDKESLGLTGRK